MIDDDITRYEQYEHDIALLKAQNPRIARIQAKRDVAVAKQKVREAQATSRYYVSERSARWYAVSIAGALTGIIVSIVAGITFTHQPNPDHDKAKRDTVIACVVNGGKWDGRNDSCDT